MKVILQQDMPNLGKIGSIVKVRDGYGRNFLIPRGIAVLADEKNTRVLNHQKLLAQSLAAKQKKAAMELADKIAANAVSFSLKAGEDDRLFGSVTAKDIVDALAQKGIVVERKKLALENPIRELGTFQVAVDLGSSVQGTVQVFVSKQ